MKKILSIGLIVFIVLIGFILAAERIENYDYNGMDLRYKINYTLIDANNFTGDIISTTDSFVSGRLVVGPVPDLTLAGPELAAFSAEVRMNQSLTVNSKPNSFSLAILESETFTDIDFRIDDKGQYDDTNNIFCDYTNNFTTNDQFRIITLLDPITFVFGATGGIDGIINGSCVNWKPEVRDISPVGDLVNQSYFLLDPAICIFYDNYAVICTADGKTGRFHFNFKNTSKENFKLDFIGSESNQILTEYMSNLNGQEGFTSFKSFISSDEDVNDTIIHNIVSEIDLKNFNGGEYHSIELNVLNPGDTETTGIVMDSEMDNIVKTTKTEDISKAWYNDTITITNITHELNNSQVITSIFTNNGSILSHLKTYKTTI